MLDVKDLKPYQVKAINHILQNPMCALFLEMSLGKTAITLTALNELLRTGFAKNILIVAPLNVAVNVWRQEAEKWRHLRHLKEQMTICCGERVSGSQKRWNMLNSETNIHIINVDNFNAMVRVCEKRELAWKWDTIIIDESSKFKAPKSNRTMALHTFWNDKSPLFGKLLRTVLLTGTPSPNGLMDLWSQIYALDGGARLGKNITAYRNSFFRMKENRKSYEIMPNCDNIILRKIGDIAMSMQTEDYLDLPDKMFSNVVVDLPPMAKEHYEKMRKDLIIKIENKEVEASNVAVSFNKLLQICNGFIYDENSIPQPIHNTKVDALKNIVDDNPNENIFVGVSFREDFPRLKAVFPEAVVLDSQNSKDVIPRWNAGEIKMLLAHPASAGHGLNLQHGGSLLVWFGLQWSLELYQQMNARLHRIGQEKPVRIIHLVSRGCLDERMVNVLDEKEGVQQKVMDELKTQELENEQA